MHFKPLFVTGIEQTTGWKDIINLSDDHPA
jgi:hypothetical protein